MEDRENGQGIMLRMNDDGVMEIFEPYTEIIVNTEDDFNKLQEALSLRDALSKAFTLGFTLQSADKEKSMKTIEELLLLMGGTEV